MDKDVTETHTKEISAILRNLNDPEKWQNSRWLNSCLVKNYSSTDQSATPSAALKAILTQTLDVLSHENANYAAILRGRYWDGLSVHQMIDIAPHYWQERNFYFLQSKAIARFATLLLEKEKNCQQAVARRKASVWLVASVSLLGLALAVIFLASPSFASTENQWTPRAQSMLFPESISTAGLTDISSLFDQASAQVVFDENFENGLGDEFTNKLGFWSVVADSNENHVLDINSMDTAIEYPVIDFGDSTWRNFVLETRIRIVDYAASNEAPLASIRFRGNYKVAFTPYWKSVDLVIDPPWQIISARTIETHKNTWYSLLIYVAEQDVYIFLNEKLILKDTLQQKYSGGFGFATWPEAHVQFDDLLIRQIEK
ncbi:MAG: hypothetical protein Fur0016_15410 [Anaerolineales bacterium]